MNKKFSLENNNKKMKLFLIEYIKFIKTKYLYLQNLLSLNKQKRKYKI